MRAQNNFTCEGFPDGKEAANEVVKLEKREKGKGDYNTIFPTAQIGFFGTSKQLELSLPTPILGRNFSEL